MLTNRTAGSKPPRVPVLEYAVRLLSTKALSIKKLRDRLTARGYGEDEVAAAIERLRSERLLDDRKFAEHYVRTRLESQPRAAFLLARELILRGISPQIAKAVVSELVPREHEENSARELLRQKARIYDNLPDPIRCRRLSGLLARRGFSPDTIRRVLRLPSENEDS